MRPRKWRHYLALGVTAFGVVAVSIVLFFALEHFSAIRELLDTVGYILRPIFYGMVLTFLLLPVQRRILAFLTQCLTGVGKEGERKRRALRCLSIFLSLGRCVLQGDNHVAQG